jgi:hypothetical protein
MKMLAASTAPMTSAGRITLCSSQLLAPKQDLRQIED